MGSGITSLTTLQSGTSLASASNSGMIHVMRYKICGWCLWVMSKFVFDLNDFRIETGSCSTRSTLIHHRQLDLNQEGSVVDLQSLDYGTLFRFVDLTKFYLTSLLFLLKAINQF
jgi:hypothetical protein